MELFVRINGLITCQASCDESVQVVFVSDPFVLGGCDLVCEGPHIPAKSIPFNKNKFVVWIDWVLKDAFYFLLACSIHCKN